MHIVNLWKFTIDKCYCDRYYHQVCLPDVYREVESANAEDDKDQLEEDKTAAVNQQYH